MALQHTDFLTIRCTDCQEEMYIQRMTLVGDDWEMLHVAPDGLVCPFCAGKANIKLLAINQGLRDACTLVTRQFDKIRDDKWPTLGMKVSIDVCRAALKELEAIDGP